MADEELEPELEALLRRYVSDIDQQWSRAADTDVAALERLVDGELPRCYRWMLRRLGRGFSDIAYGSLDLSARTIVQMHQRGRVEPIDGMLFIGADEDTFQPQPRYYDLANGSDDDAPVVATGPEEGERTVEFDSLRAFIASPIFTHHHVRTLPSQVEAVFVCDDDVGPMPELIPVLEDQGFSAVIDVGPHCPLYAADDFALCGYRQPEDLHARRLMSVRVGGPSETALRRVLGVLAAETNVRLDRVHWPRVGR